MTRSVRRRLVGWSICPSFQNGLEVTLSCNFQVPTGAIAFLKFSIFKVKRVAADVNMKGQK